MGVFRWLRKKLRHSRLPVNVNEIESAIGYHFKDSSLLIRSLKHRSYSQAMDGNIDLSNERLEFLGDSVLNMVVSHHLFINNPTFQEGELTKLKSVIVSKKAATIAGRSAGIDRFILLSESEEDSGGRSRASIIADTYEAIIGAIFLDGGLKPSREFIHRSILDNFNLVLEEVQANYKSLLLELTQAQKLGLPVYKTIYEDGPDHDKMFTVEVLVRSEPCGKGRGKNKKAAQQMAAKEGFEYLMKHNKDR